MCRRLASSLVLVTMLLSLPLVGRAAEAPYNLLVIQTDEHNFRTLGCYRELLSKEQALMWGPSVVETPHIDSIAHDGAICTSFYATTPVCSPSRAALVSGRYPQNTPVVTNNIPLADDIVTFAEILRRKGYATGFMGKWHLDGPGKPQWAPKRKFGFADNRYMFNRGHWKQLELTSTGPRVAARDNKGKPSYSIQGATEKNFTTDFLTDRAVEFIGDHKRKPWCLYVSLPDPHGPDTVRAPYDTMFAAQTYAKPRTYDVSADGVPAWGQPAPKSGYGQAAYYGMVRCIDDNVGKVLAALKRDGTYDRTIVIFTSDHGDLRGEHRRQNKGVPYEGSSRVPFLVRAPGKVRPRTVIGEALTFVDFLPTVLALMDVPVEIDVEGRDASALFRTGSAPDDWTDVAFMRSTGSGASGWLAVLTDRYKLVFSSSDTPWLFDLEKDPDELENFFLDPAYRETVRELAEAARLYAANHGDPLLGVPRIRADVKWAIEGEGAYEGTPPKQEANPTGRKKRKAGDRTGKPKKEHRPATESS